MSKQIENIAGIVKELLFRGKNIFFILLPKLIINDLKDYYNLILKWQLRNATNPILNDNTVKLIYK